MIFWLTFFFSGIIILSIILMGFKWKNFRLFFNDETYTYFDISFVILYFLEQAVFIILSFFYPDLNRLFIGFFALIVVSTVSLQKIMLESKNKRFGELNARYLGYIAEMRDQYENTIDTLLSDMQILEEDAEILRGYIRGLNKLKK